MEYLMGGIKKFSGEKVPVVLPRVKVIFFLLLKSTDMTLKIHGE